MKDLAKYLINSTATVIEALKRLNELSSDILTLFVINEENQVIGTLTDGDIRRGLINGTDLNDNISGIINRSFYFLNKGNLSLQKIKNIREKNIRLLPFLNQDGKVEKLYDLKRRKTILPIDAVLMAGGRGERLRPLTDSVPKPMLLIGNKPIIEYNIDRLIFNGIDNYFISINYLAEQIDSYFGDGTKKGININYIRETKPLGTIGSVSLIKDFYNDTILIMNSDLFTNINYEDFYQDFISSNADMSIASIPYSVSVPYAILNFEKDAITSFEEKPIYTYHANAGIYLVKRKMLNIIPINEFFNATDFMQTLINNNHKVVKYPIIGYWIDIGRHEDYNKVQEIVKHLSD